jgi:hexosaminidase
MRNRYSYARLEYSDLWLRENRPYRLQNVLVRYDLATQLWVLRSDKFVVTRQQWQQQRTLPSPAELGIP